MQEQQDEKEIWKLHLYRNENILNNLISNENH